MQSAAAPQFAILQRLCDFCRITIVAPLDGSVRSKHKIPTEIATEVTVRKGSKRIDFKVSMTNLCKDHMLVVDFPTGIQTATADWEAPFEIRTRDVDNFSDNHGIKGPELERQAIQNFVNVSDDKSAFALMSKGLKEVGTRDENGTVLTLTLLRAATGRFPIHDDLIIGSDDAPSQCIGEDYTFEYAILIHNNEDLIAESRKYITPMISAQTGVSDGGTIPAVYSMLSHDNHNVCLSALKTNEDGAMILRLFNPTGETLSDRITVAKQIHSAQEVRLDETKLRELEVSDGVIDISVKPYTIMTIRMD